MSELLATELLSVTVKSSLLLLAVAALTRLMRRRSAAERHAVWMLAIVALLVLPVLGAVAPRIAVPLGGDLLQRTTAAFDAASTPAAAAGANDVEVAAGVTAAPTAATSTALDSGAAPISSAGAPARGSSMLSNAAALLVFVWLSGGCLLLVRYGLLRRRVAKHVRRLPHVADPALQALIDVIRERFGIRRDVVALRCAHSGSPWLWGIRSPRLVLPVDFCSWSASAREQALLHELAHVARRDQLSALTTQLCCALHWFNPLVWFAARRIRLEAEEACDDRVIASGAPAADYAQQLLRIASRTFSETGHSVWVPAMAHRSSLSPRVHAILDATRRRNTMTMPKKTVFAAAALSCVLPLAALQSQQTLPEVNDTEFLQLVQRGPNGSDELETIVDTYVAGGMPDAAADAAARFMLKEYGTSDELYVCNYCGVVLATERTPRQHRHFEVMVAALELIAARATESGSGDALLQVVLNSFAATGNRAALERATYYVVRALQIGVEQDVSLGIVAFMYERGSVAEALDLARRVVASEESVHYQSKTAEQWVTFLEREVERRASITRMIFDSLGVTEVLSDGDYLPMTKAPPVYPAAAAEQRLEGHVVVEFTVNTEGRPEDVTIVESTDPVFNESALAAVRDFRYAPRLVSGAPVAVPGVRNRIAYRLQ